MAEALGALDAGGWMHGDVKPSNIFLSPQGHVTLLDLGFARRRGESGTAADRCVMGTGHYLAPECITAAAAADIRSDIYSLGAVLFQILAGRLPLEGDEAWRNWRSSTAATPRRACRSWPRSCRGRRGLRWSAA